MQQGISDIEPPSGCGVASMMVVRRISRLVLTPVSVSRTKDIAGGLCSHDNIRYLGAQAPRKLFHLNFKVRQQSIMARIEPHVFSS